MSRTQHLLYFTKQLSNVKLVFEIRKNLNLRKILVTHKIFLKSRFIWTYSGKGPFKYYVIMILTFFYPPTLSSDVSISFTHLKHDVIISSYPPTY